MPSRPPSSSAAAVHVLTSGGVDSAVLLGEALARGARVRPVYVRAGLRWERAELAWLRRFLRRLASPRLETLAILSLDARALYGAHWSVGKGRVPGARSADAAVELPGRNALLLTQVACHAALLGSSRLEIGLLAGNPFRDATPAFLKRLSSLLAEALGRPITIAAPLARLRKADVLSLGTRLPLELTFSCIDPQGTRHCGRCNKCVERKKAFFEAGIRDKTSYQKAGLGT